MLASYLEEPVSKIEQMAHYTNVQIITTKKGHKYVRKQTVKPEREDNMMKKAASVGIAVPQSLTKDGFLYMEYIANARYFNPMLAKTISHYVKELARILAFNVITGNLDNFTFISYFLDNIYYASQPNFHAVNIFMAPMINEGNLLISQDKIWLIDLDDFALHNPSWSHFVRNLARSTLYDLTAVFSNYMHFSQNDSIQFRKEFLFFYDDFKVSL